MPRPRSIAYWRNVSAEDWKTAEALFASRRYAHALLFGHQALEKALKALLTARQDKTPPFTHDLLRLAREAGIDLTREQAAFLEDVNRFHLQARYPEEKLAFYRKASKAFTAKNLAEIERWLRRLENELR